MFNNKKLYICFLSLFIMAGSVLSQPTPPLSPDLTPLFPYTSGTSIRIEIDPTIHESNAAFCPGVQYRFWRVTIRGREGLNVETGWLSEPYYIFSGMADGEEFYFRAQARCGDDTTRRSIPERTMMDVYAPSIIEHINIALCSRPGDAVHPVVTLVWPRATDTASGVEKYLVYRAQYASPLNWIREGDPYLAMVPDNGSDCFDFSDTPSTGLLPERTYYYTVVAVDSVGNYHAYYNPIVAVETTVPFPLLPPCGFLEELPEFYNTPALEVCVDLERCPPSVCGGCEGTRYRFKRWTEGVGDTVTTGWQTDHCYLWDGEECVTYGYRAQAKYYDVADDSFRVGPWGPVETSTRDSRGPYAVDSVAGETQPGGWNLIHWYVPAGDTAALDCASGLSHYNIYRVTRDSLVDLFPISGPSAALHLVATVAPRGVSVYEYADYGTFQWGTCYYYTVVGVDELGFFSPDPFPMDTVCLPAKIAAPVAVTLSNWTCTDSVFLEIVDTNCGLAESLMVHMALYPDFRDADSTAWMHFDNPLLHRAAGPVTCWEEMYYIFRDLEENRYYFRAKCKDILGNVSEWSNVVNTRIDNAPPGSPIIDNIYSRADGVGTVDVTISWIPVTDRGSGLAAYLIYRSNTFGDIGTLMDSLPPWMLSWIDGDPNPADIFHQNFYKIVSVDYCGHQGLLGTQAAFEEDVTPPVSPVVDDVWVTYSEEYTIIEWTDMTPPGYGFSAANRYQLEHSVVEDWLYIHPYDPLLLEQEPLTYNRACTLLTSVVFSGTHTKYFHIKAIDVWGNESGYSESFEFSYTPPPDDTICVDFCAGWNLISLPLRPSYTNDAHVLMSPATLLGDPFYYDPATSEYVPTSDLYIGRGYWVHLAADATVCFVGRALEEYSVPVFYGWNIIGGIAFNGDFTTDPDNVHIGDIWYVDCGTGSYTDTDYLLPAHGHWFMVDEDAMLSVFPAARKILPNTEPDWLVEIEAGAQKLYFGAQEAATNGYDNRLDKIAPPPPPFLDGYASFISEDGQQLISDIRSPNDAAWEMNISSPTLLSWNSRELPEGEFELYDETFNNTFNMRKISSYNAVGKIRITYVQSLPENYTLYQNVPNPFNASTEISFYLEEDARVKLVVLDVLGREVKTLINRNCEHGLNTIYWDGYDNNGESAGSGIYFYAIITRDFQSTKKMLLLR